MDTISVLVVDDSALMRNLISRIIDQSPDLSVVGRAMNGRFAMEKIPRLNPDIIILDLEMPEMNGIEFLNERKRQGMEIPVLILSSHAQKGAKVTMEALSLGASEFIMKPTGEEGQDIAAVSAQLTELVRAYGGSYRQRTRGAAGGAPPSAPQTSTAYEPAARSGHAPAAAPARSLYDLPKRTPSRKPGPVRLVAIGISTGGPNALRKVLPLIDADMNLPILIVQHMPAGFTAEFAVSLGRICALEVKEAKDGDLVKPRRVLIAPGDKHMRVERRSLATVVRISDDEAVSGHRPSADVLFASVAATYGNEAMGVIMTGMGRDGAREIGTMYEAGALTIGQDEASSVVYGMPRAAHAAGYLYRQFSLEDLGGILNDTAREYGASE
ncbi:MAG: protein-glutamate methylesterase/protein-glutamine glutaminase [Spirochaetota bacterium]